MPFDREIHPEALESAYEVEVRARRELILKRAARSREVLTPPPELRGKLYSARDLLEHRLADIDRQNADLVGKGFSTMRKS